MGLTALVAVDPGSVDSACISFFVSQNGCSYMKRNPFESESRSKRRSV